MTTSLIIPIYIANKKLENITHDCLASLRYGRPDEVILVDDGSPLLFTPSGAIKVVRLDNNTGYCGAVNAGLKVSRGDYLIVGNNDLIFTPGWLGGLLYPLRHGYDISSICISDSDGYTTEDKITDDDKFGSLFAMKRSAYEQIGGFDEDYRDFFGDLDLQERAKRAGLRIGKNHNAVVEHLGHATFDEVDPEDERYKYGRRVFVEKWEDKMK